MQYIKIDIWSRIIYLHMEYISYMFISDAVDQEG